MIQTRVDLEKLSRVDCYSDILTTAALACIELGIYWAPDSEGKYGDSASIAGRLLKRMYAPIYDVVVEDSANKVNGWCRNLYRRHDQRLNDAITHLFCDRPDLFVSWSSIDSADQTLIINTDTSTLKVTLDYVNSEHTKKSSQFIQLKMLENKYLGLISSL